MAYQTPKDYFETPWSREDPVDFTTWAPTDSPYAHIPVIQNQQPQERVEIITFDANARVQQYMPIASPRKDWDNTDYSADIDTSQISTVSFDNDSFVWSKPKSDGPWEPVSKSSVSFANESYEWDLTRVSAPSLAWEDIVHKETHGKRPRQEKYVQEESSSLSEEPPAKKRKKRKARKPSRIDTPSPKPSPKVLERTEVDTGLTLSVDTSPGSFALSELAALSEVKVARGLDEELRLAIEPKRSRDNGEDFDPLAAQTASFSSIPESSEEPLKFAIDFTNLSEDEDDGVLSKILDGGTNRGNISLFGKRVVKRLLAHPDQLRAGLCQRIDELLSQIH